MKRHLWITLPRGMAGSGKGRETCAHCRLIRLSVRPVGSSPIHKPVTLYGRDGLHWSTAFPVPACEEPARGVDALIPLRGAGD